MAASMQSAYEKAGEAYETMGTQVREDLGDSIEKAFGNVAEILAGLGFEDTEANEKAVRILGYNSMDITKRRTAERWPIWLPNALKRKWNLSQKVTFGQSEPLCVRF